MCLSRSKAGENMGNSIGEISLDLVVNKTGFEKQMSGVKRSAEDAGRSITGSFSGVQTSIAGIGKKIAGTFAGIFAVKKIADFGSECLKLGSDLQEVQNVVDVTFPTMSAKVDEFAKNAANSFGLSETMAKRYTGTFGAMAKAFGFTEESAYQMGTTLTGLAGDVASFYNISQDEAYTKLKSVFTGETETLKDLGIVMTEAALNSYALSQGIGTTVNQMSEAEKVALRYRFVQDQLALATGDFARTSGSWANQMRILTFQLDSFKATIGQGLINLFTPIIQVVNTLMGKLVKLAEAFKGFTELITGKKSEEGSWGTGTADSMAAAADTANMAAQNLQAADQAGASTGSGLSSAADSADDLAGNTKKAGKAAKQAAKDMKSLMGFDVINKLSDSPDSSSDDPSGGTGGSSGKKPSGAGVPDIGGTIGAADFGSVAKGGTVLDSVSSGFQKVIDRLKELAGLFQKGFWEGIGDLSVLDSIRDEIKGIGESLKEIFTDPEVVDAGNRFLDSLAYNLGRVSGSVVSIGLTIADNLLGGIDLYLDQNKDRIKDFLVHMFDIGSERAQIAGDFAVTVADIFSVFRGDTAKQITADIISIFSESHMGAMEIAGKLGNDILDTITKPIVDNKDKIKSTIERILEPLSTVSGKLADAVRDTMDKARAVYDEHIAPMFDSIKNGLSDILSNLLDGYNMYIAPVLYALAYKFTDVWNAHIQPAIDGFLDLIGKLGDSIKKIWEETLKPFIDWMVQTILPILAPIIEAIDAFFLDAFGVIGDVISDLWDALGGLIDFITGVFTADWNQAWEGLKTFFEGIWTGIKDFLSGTWNAIKDLFAPLVEWFSNLFSRAWEGIKESWSSVAGWFGNLWTGIKETFSDVGSWFSNMFSKAWEGIKSVWSKVTGFFSDIWKGIQNTFGHVKDWFKDKFSAAWQAVKDVFSTGGRIFDGIKDGILSGLKAVVNAIIDGINKVVSIPFNGINSALRAIRDVNILGLRPFSWLGEIGVPQIPRLAQGGYVKANTPQLAMIGDNRHQGEVVAPEDKLLEMAKMAAAASGQNVPVSELVSLLRQILEYLKQHELVEIDPEAMRKWFIKKTNQKTKETGVCEILI